MMDCVCVLCVMVLVVFPHLRHVLQYRSESQ